MTASIETMVLEQAGLGKTTREISAWLLAEHNISASHAKVARILERSRVERADTAKAVVREQLSKTLTADISRLEKHAAQLDALADQLLSADNLSEYRKTVEQLRKVTDTKLHYSGADQPDTTDATEATEAITRGLARLAAARDAG